MKKEIGLIIVIVSMLLFFSAGHATIWYVHPDSTLNSIQAGLDSCADNDTVLVAAGIYYENLTWAYTNGILLISESGPVATIIDGDSVASVIIITPGVDSSTIINGFTIRNGYSTSGGGIYCSTNSSPTITGNIITGNIADYGGGIFEYSISSPIIGNTITGNTATLYGGGIFLTGASPIIIDNTITGNTANGGGGIAMAVSSPTITRNIITGNSAVGGGGIYCVNYSSPIIDSCSISGNIYDGIYCTDASTPIINYNNITGHTGYGVCNFDPDVIVNAEYNWWGDTSGPGGAGPGTGDEVSNWVDYEPWLTDSIAGVEEQETPQKNFFICKTEPNPFKERTLIIYQLPQNSNVHIIVYNLLGQEVKKLLNGKNSAGVHTIMWDGRNNAGHSIPVGIYFLQLKTGNYNTTMKLLKVR